MLNVFSRADGIADSVDRNRLLEAAATAFVRKGYSNTTFIDIGVLMGCSENQIKSIYETKELLFKDVLLDMADTDVLFKNSFDIVEMLSIILNRMKDEILNKDIRAEFFNLLINSKDLPEMALESFDAGIKESKLYDALAKAQMKGIVVKGNTLELFKQFVISSYTIIRGYIIADLKIPGNDFFLSILKYSDDASSKADKELIKQQSSVIAAFASDFQNVLFVNLDDNSVDVYQVNGEHDSWVSNAVQKGFEEYKRLFADRFIQDSDRDEFFKELSTENLLDKLEEDPVFCYDHKVLSRGTLVSYQTKIVLDPMYSYGNRVLIAGRRVYD